MRVGLKGVSQRQRRRGKKKARAPGRRMRREDGSGTMFARISPVILAMVWKLK